MSHKPQPGITGAGSGVTGIGQLIELLRPHFAPSSYLRPPIAASSGGRGSSAQPSQSTTLALKAGGLTWIFPAPFNVSPVVQITPVGPPTSGTPVIYIKAISPSQVAIVSTLATDARLVHLTATGNPN